MKQMTAFITLRMGIRKNSKVRGRKEGSQNNIVHIVGNCLFT